jgi:uncharacterized OB-fold protein
MSPAPVDEGIFTWPSDRPQLIGSACRVCGAVSFPRQGSCSRCTSEDLEDRLLGRVGTLWSYTVQGFRPPEPYLGPAEFVPYGVGYVELPGEVIVESRLTEADVDALEIGARMELVVEPFARRADGTELVTFAFRPMVGEGDS